MKLYCVEYKNKYSVNPDGMGHGFVLANSKRSAMKDIEGAINAWVASDNDVRPYGRSLSEIRENLETADGCIKNIRR